jgi:3-isopropylmalate dehydrogenase
MGDKPWRIAVAPRDGIGPEVIGEVAPLFDALSREDIGPFGVGTLEFGADWPLGNGEAMPVDGFERLVKFGAIRLDAHGDPQVSDPDYLRRVLLAMRFEMDLLVNLRPVRCLEERLSA